LTDTKPVDPHGASTAPPSAIPPSVTGPGVPVIDLSAAPGTREAWDQPTWKIYLWAVCEVVVLRNPLQPSSGLRARALRAFGARVGEGVLLRPGLRVKFPWKLSVGDRSWLGEDVWIHNQGQLDIGADAVVSQETFITTGTHRFRGDMGLETRPVVIEDGAWITSRCTILAGTRIGRSALVLPSTVVDSDVPPNALYGHTRSHVVGQRFPNHEPDPTSDANL
jgi:putative colanic acid biosynthesis acetyltransferase WcaF